MGDHLYVVAGEALKVVEVTKRASGNERKPEREERNQLKRAPVKRRGSELSCLSEMREDTVSGWGWKL